MARLQLFEIGDQAWCPRAIRDGTTDYLRFVIEQSRPYAAIAPRLGAAIARTNTTRLVDLCSGGAGPWPDLLDDLAVEDKSPTVTLTDLYPNVEAFGRTKRRASGRVDFRAEPVDATRVPADLPGFRTLFSAFHHFAPERALQVLRDAVDHRQPIAAFEATQRRPVALLAMLLTPLIVLLVTPLIRPFRWSRLLLTYAVPIIPLVVMVDGLVSCLRTYSPDELRELTAALGDADYSWEIGEAPIPGSPIAATFLIGTPRVDEGRA